MNCYPGLARLITPVPSIAVIFPESSEAKPAPKDCILPEISYNRTLAERFGTVGSPI